MAPEVVKHHLKNITTKISQMQGRKVEDEIILKISREKIKRKYLEKFCLS